MSPGFVLPISILGAITLIVALAGVSVYQTRLRPLGLWLLAWSAQLLGATVVLVSFEEPSVRPVALLFGSLVAPLMLMGAYRFVDREPPVWILGVAILAGAFRIATYQDGLEVWSIGLAATLEPALALFAAWLVTTRRNGRKVDRVDQLLAVGFALFAVAEASDALLQLTTASNWLHWGTWAGFGLPLLVIQLTAVLRRLRQEAVEHEQNAYRYEQRLRLITESSDFLVIEYDELGFITFASENCREQIGIPSDVLTGLDARKLYKGRSDSPIAKVLEKNGRITEQDVLDFPTTPTRSVLVGGRTVSYEVDRTTYRTEDGELRILTYARDISDRIKHAEEIRKSELRLNRAERIGRSGSWEYFPETAELFWSDHHFRLHGLEPEPCPVDLAKVQHFMDPEDLRALIEGIGRLDAGQSSPELRYRITRADDGAPRQLQALGEIETDSRGHVVRVTGASRDITEQQELEDRLREGREHLDALVGSNIVGVFYAHTDGRILEANDAFLELLGFSQSDLPLSWVALTPSDRRARDEIARDEYRETGRTRPFEKEFLSRDGERIPMLVGCAQMRPELALVMAIDQSERQRAARFIEQQQQKLEETIAERTQELLESRSRLIEAERLAAVGTLAAGVAHQINNPIGAILNSTEYALLCADDKTAIETFQEALESNLVEARRCAQIVRSMLQFSRDEPTRKWIEDLNRVTLRAHRAIQAYAQDRGAHVSVHSTSEPFLARISPIEIEQAIVNVLRNAIESREWGASISLSLSRRDKAAQIEIVDDGQGIAAEDRDHLFEPFYSTRTRVGGTGLGLSVAHGVVKDHGGQIRVESVLGEGTRVVISLPIVDAAAIAGETDAAAETASDDGLTPGKAAPSPD